MPAAADSGAGGTAPSQTEAQKASADAAATGQRVEVVGQRTEYAQTFANPDGVTYTTEQSVAPQRVKLPDGSFVPPDATLVHRSDGSVGPRAAVADISFSGGGSGSGLVRLSEGDRSLGLGWNGTLPAPVLDGPTATYPEVLPGVDLRMTASTEGFRQTLVVKSREAAENPDLAQVSFTLDAEGLTAEQGLGGSLRAVDENGNTVFTAPAGQMWDSAGTAESAAEIASTGAARFQSAPAVTQAPDGDPSPDPADGPGDGAASAVLPVHLDGDILHVDPDTQVLRGAGTVYPVYIDPQTGLNESERTVLSSDGDKFWMFSGDMGVGHCGTYNGYTCGSGYTNRMYFEFSPAGLGGKRILDATFRVTETWSFSCDPTWVNLSRTDNISSATSWPGPSALDLMGDRLVSHGRGTACSPDQPAAPVEFHDDAAEPDENLTPTVQSFADGKWSRLTLRLSAKDELDTNSWKRFKDDAVLSITYVGVPATPTNTGLMGDGVHRTCEKDANQPETLSDPTPKMTSTAQTEPGGESSAQLRLMFDIEKKNTDATWSTVGSVLQRPSGTAYIADGASQTLDAPTLSEGQVYRMKTWTRSYYDNGASYMGSAYTPYCYFKVDPTAPKAPAITLRSPYSECLPNSCVPAGAPLTKATFGFAPNAADTNISSYTYKMSSDSAWSAAVSGSTGGSFVPQTGGTFIVQVRATDSLGRTGAIASKQFVVAEGDGPVGQWRFDEASGAAVDTSTTDPALRDDATLSSGAGRDSKGRRGMVGYDAYGNALSTPTLDSALSLNGTSTSYATTGGPGVDTRASYTVSAWARLDSGTGNATVFGQDGTHNSAFFLSYLSADKAWSLTVPSADVTTGYSLVKIGNPQPAVIGAWTHLLAAYDGTAHEVRLYVNGRKVGSAPFTTPWNATGALQMGRAKWLDNETGYFKGDIDEVRLWQRTLSDTEIAREADAVLPNDYNAMTLMASWNPTDGTGSTVPDVASGYGRNLVLSPTGASLDAENGLTLDGNSGAATTPGPVLDDSGSFTVTAETRLDQAALSHKPVGYTAQVFGERTSSGSSWGLWYRQTAADPDLETAEGFWEFGRLNDDGTFTAVESMSTAAMDSLQRLTGTYDSVTGQISFYTGKSQQYAPADFAPMSGTGDLAAGKGYTSGAWGHYLPGAVTDLRVWAGAAADTQQLGEVVLAEGAAGS